MEEQIKRAVRNLNISYVLFWVLPAFLLGAGEFELIPVGILEGNVQATYYFETARYPADGLVHTSFPETIQPCTEKEDRQHDHYPSAETLCADEHRPVGNT